MVSRNRWSDSWQLPMVHAVSFLQAGDRLEGQSNAAFPDRTALDHLLMMRIAAFLLAAFLLVFLATPVMAAKVGYCAQAHDSAATRLQWALERQRNAMTLQKDDSCRVYRAEFYEAAVTRQNITHCEEDDMRQSALKVIDAEINAFNDLIATYCSD
jgi:hypothetical protein